MSGKIFVNIEKGKIKVYRDGVLLNRKSAIDALSNIFRAETDQTSENAKILSQLIRELQAA